MDDSAPWYANVALWSLWPLHTSIPVNIPVTWLYCLSPYLCLVFLINLYGDNRGVWCMPANNLWYTNYNTFDISPGYLPTSYIGLDSEQQTRSLIIKRTSSFLKTFNIGLQDWTTGNFFSERRKVVSRWCWSNERQWLLPPDEITD